MPSATYLAVRFEILFQEETLLFLYLRKIIDDKKKIEGITGYKVVILNDQKERQQMVLRQIFLKFEDQLNIPIYLHPWMVRKFEIATAYPHSRQTADIHFGREAGQLFDLQQRT